MRGLLPLLAVILLPAACGGPPEGNSGADEVTSDRAIRSQAVLNAIDPEGPGCSAAVGNDGTVVWAGVRGIANLATGTPITTDTVFDIASVSKQFTATAILLLVQEGRLGLDDRLSDHVPGLPGWAATVTVGQLMHQTSGIPDYTGLLEEQGFEDSDHTTQADALKALAAVPTLEFEPATQFEYSNSNYILLAEIVQDVSGTPLPKFLAANIFGPLGLAMVADPTETVPNRALSYQKDGGHYAVADSWWEQVGDGSIQTTPSQLVRWADDYRTGKVGGPGLLEAQLAGAVETGPGDDGRYGAGIFVLGDGMLEHSGGWGGFVSEFVVSADRRTAVAVSCNADDQDPDTLVSALATIWM